MKLQPGVYDATPEASEFPHGPVIVMDDGRCIHFDLYMEEQAETCFAALSAAPQPPAEVPNAQPR